MNSSKNVIECVNVTKIWNDDYAEPVTAIQDINVSIKEGEIFVFIGPSGCGKSTLLEMIAGIESPTEGSILLDGVEITGPSAAACLIYQGPSLFPWTTIQKNVEFPLNVQHIPKPERHEKAKKIIERVGLNGFENRYPHQLSGGMQQRAAIARAIIGNPRVLLMDESFGFLDAQTRFNMQQFLLEIWEFSKKTIVFVTHHVEEAIFLADRIFVMTGRPGRKKQLIEIDIERPRDLFSKRFEEIRKEIFELLQSEVGTFGNSRS